MGFGPQLPENKYRRQEVDRNLLLRALLWNGPSLVQDLELDTLLRAMAGDDEFVWAVAQHALLKGFDNDLDTVLYRQAVLSDCLRNPIVVRGIYDLMTGIGEEVRRQWWSTSSEHPGSMLYGSVDLMETSVKVASYPLNVCGVKPAKNINRQQGLRSSLSVAKHPQSVVRLDQYHPAIPLNGRSGSAAEV